MPYQVIENYYLTYSDIPIIWIRLAGETRVQATSVIASDVVFVADMLRYEKPVYYNPDIKQFSTIGEEVGEEES